MTAVAGAITVTDLTDAELEVGLLAADPDCPAYGDIAAEIDRRDAAAKRSHAARERYATGAWGASDAEWETAAYAQYLAADAATRGCLLSEAGQATGRDPWPMLWQGSEDTARRLSSEELITYWDYASPRVPGPGEFRAAHHAQETQAREEAMLGGLGGAVMHGAERAASEAVRQGGRAALRGATQGRPQPAATSARQDRMAALRQRAAELDVRNQLRQAAATAGAGTVAVRDEATPAPIDSGAPTMRSSNPTDGVAALTLLSQFFAHYDHWAAPEFTDLMAAWCLQTHALEDDGGPIWRALPRLIVCAGSGCGKSGTLAQLAMATGSSVLAKVSYAGIRDTIGKDREVAILDEAQATFGAGRKSEDVRMVINCHVKGTKVRDAKGPISVHGQVAMAGLPKLLTGKLAFEIADTLSRCLVLWKERKPKGVHVPEVTDAAEALIRDVVVPQMREWCLDSRDGLRARAAEFGAGAPTGLPDLGGGGRGNDQLARPLLAVCDVATALVPQTVRDTDPSGGWDWSARIRRALVFVSGVPEPVEQDEDEGPTSALDSAAASFADLWAAEAAATADATGE